MHRPQWLIGLVSFLFGVGVDMSPMQSWWLSGLFWVLAFVLLMWWLWPHRKKVRLQWPLARHRGATHSTPLAAPPSRSIRMPPTDLGDIEHLGASWSGQRYNDGEIVVSGPFCPDDGTPLGSRRASILPRNERDVPVLHDQDVISIFETPVCSQCGREFSFLQSASGVIQIREIKEQVQHRFARQYRSEVS